jgi:ribosomal protein S12 methylthiotransferase accessory factor
MRLSLPARAPKAAGLHDRELSTAYALESIARLRNRFRITRVCETTRLDRTGVPTVCAIVPESLDDISIYNGKGITREQALIGAVMEAVERQTAAMCDIPSHERKPTDLHRGIDVRACGLRDGYAEREISFVPAWDALSGEPIDVPKALVQMPWRGDCPFPVTHTSGLAAGFTMMEAVYHALFELVERHLWALVHARAHLRPQHMLSKFFASIGAGSAPDTLCDDPVIEIRTPTGDADVDGLCQRIDAAGLRLRLVAMGQPGFPIAVLASLHERAYGTETLHTGCGCSWSPGHACVRAITEAVQSRVADIQGARENIVRFSDPATRFTGHTRRRNALPHGRWYFDGPSVLVDFGEIADRSSDDLAEEFQRLLAVVATVATRVAVVDLSPPSGRYSVVRVIVPELESTAIDGRLGASAQAIVERRTAPTPKQPLSAAPH